MPRIDLMITNGTIKEYRPESAWAYHRRIRRQMRHVWPLHETLFAAIETLFWLLLAGLVIAAVIAFPVMFVRWWMCM